MFWPHYPGGISSSDRTQWYTQRAYNAQYFRANIRKSHPPTMYLDDAILVREKVVLRDFFSRNQKATGLEDYPQFLTQEPETPELSPRCGLDCPCCYTPGQGTLEEEALDDGMISPLELPVRHKVSCWR